MGRGEAVKIPNARFCVAMFLSHQYRVENVRKITTFPFGNLYAIYLLVLTVYVIFMR